MSELSWKAVDLSANSKAKKAYEEYRQAMKLAQEARENFESIIMPKAQAMAGDDLEPVFSYRFGKLSMAFKAKGSKSSTKSAKDAISF